MVKLWFRIFEVGVVRGLPGIVSLVSLLMIADRFGPQKYGAFSTIWATALFVMSLIYGIVSQSIVPSHARHFQMGNHHHFERGVLGGALAISAFFLALSAIAHLSGSAVLSACALIVALTGLVQVMQQTLQARIALWAYGIVSFGQAVAFLTLIIVAGEGTLEIAQSLYLYAFSQLPAVLLGFFFLGAPRPQLPSASLLAEFRTTGFPLTMGSLAENSLLTCFRWVIALWASPAFLSAFSFAVDLVQRSVSIFLNLIGFALIPTAYRNCASDPDDVAFRRMLWRGAAIGVAAAVAMVIVIVIVAGTGLISALAQPTFVPWMFVTIAGAAIVNRLKKVAIDPIAVRRRRTSSVSVGYLIGGPIALSGAALALVTGYPALVVPLYLAGFCIAAIVTAFWSTHQRTQQERPA